MKYPTSVKLWACDLPPNPMSFPDRHAEAAEFFTRHRGCYVERATLVSRELIRTEKPCDLASEHAEFGFNPALFPEPEAVQ